jgi:hypothetical protein
MMLKKLTIQNINSISGKYIGHWKIHLVLTTPTTYTIKVIHNGSPFDMFNLIIDRYYGNGKWHRIDCNETNKFTIVPIDNMEDRDVFLRFLIDELI